MVIICVSVNKTPIDAQMKLKPGIRIVNSGKIVMFEAETCICRDRIQILKPEEGSEITNAKMQIIGNIRPVTDANAILEEKFPENR